MDWFMGRSRKKDKDATTAAVQGEPKLYLQEQFLQLQICKLDLVSLVQLPRGLDYYEWLACNTIKFFELTNLMFGTISEFCTQTGCASMLAPNMTQYLWFDERGKKCKCAAPQYIDYVMTFIHKCVIDERIFPTKYGNVFPSSFESICKKIHRYLLHVMAHMYHSHFKELALLQLHAHMNWLFLHFTMFVRAFQLVDEKEMEVLRDLAEQLHNKYQLLMSAASAAAQAVTDTSSADVAGATVTEADGCADVVPAPHLSQQPRQVLQEQQLPATALQQPPLTSTDASLQRPTLISDQPPSTERALTGECRNELVREPPTLSEVMYEEELTAAAGITTTQPVSMRMVPPLVADSGDTLDLGAARRSDGVEGENVGAGTPSLANISDAMEGCDSGTSTSNCPAVPGSSASSDATVAAADNNSPPPSSCKVNHVTSSSSSSSDVGPVEQ